MAQTTVTPTLCCKKTEKTLQALTGGLFPAMKEQETFGTIKALMDSTLSNEINVVSMTKPGDANCPAAVVDVKYRKPQCDTPSDGCTVDFYDCTVGDSAPEEYGYDRYTIDECTDYSFTISLADFDCNCENPSEELAAKMFRAYRSMVKGMNDKLIEKLYASMGNYFTEAGATPVSSVATPETLKIFSPDGKPQPLGWFKMIEQFQRQCPDGTTPLVVAGTAKLRAYEWAKDLFIGNLDGNDASKKSDVFRGYTDYAVDSVLAAAGATTTNNILAFLPNSVQVLEWYNFETTQKSTDASGRVTWVPTQVSNSGTLVRQKIDLGAAVGRMPFVVDMQIQLDECANKITYKFKKCYDLWCIPQDAFSADCNQAHNYKVAYTLDCAALDCGAFC